MLYSFAYYAFTYQHIEQFYECRCEYFHIMDQSSKPRVLLERTLCNTRVWLNHCSIIVGKNNGQMIATLGHFFFQSHNPFWSKQIL